MNCGFHVLFIYVHVCSLGFGCDMCCFLTESDTADDSNNVGEPLVLTSYIKNGEIKDARTLSKVLPNIDGWTSYSGYFTVNEDCGSNMFFWFFPAKSNCTTAPILLWLQGGPGYASLFGLFKENGPFNHCPDGLESRDLTWSNECNLLYIDQPVGTGYSFSRDKCYPTNLTVVVQEMYSALTQFFQMFPELQHNRFFIAGESFAGHYIPALAAYIHNNPTSIAKINFAGMVLGNPLVQMTCHDYATFLYDWGAVDENLRDKIRGRQEMLKNHVDAEQYSDAFEDWKYILINLTSLITKLSDLENMIAGSDDNSDYQDWLITPEVRQQIHVGNTEYIEFCSDVYINLKNTMPQSMTREIEQILDAKNYSVGFYSGNQDMICMYTSTECVLKGLNWWGKPDYLSAERQPWYVGDSLVGWVKMAGPLYEIVIRGAGHFVPTDQPQVIYQLIRTILTVDPGINPVSKLITSSRF